MLCYAITLAAVKRLGRLRFCLPCATWATMNEIVDPALAEKAFARIGSTMPSVGFGMSLNDGLVFLGPDGLRQLVEAGFQAFTHPGCLHIQRGIIRLEQHPTGGVPVVCSVMLERTKGIILAGCFRERDKHSKSIRRAFQQIARASVAR